MQYPKKEESISTIVVEMFKKETNEKGYLLEHIRRMFSKVLPSPSNSIVILDHLYLTNILFYLVYVENVSQSVVFFNQNEIMYLKNILETKYKPLLSRLTSIPEKLPALQMKRRKFLVFIEEMQDFSEFVTSIKKKQNLLDELDFIVVFSSDIEFSDKEEELLSIFEHDEFPKFVEMFKRIFYGPEMVESADRVSEIKGPYKLNLNYYIYDNTVIFRRNVIADIIQFGDFFGLNKLCDYRYIYKYSVKNSLEKLTSHIAKNRVYFPFHVEYCKILVDQKLDGKASKLLNFYAHETMQFFDDPKIIKALLKNPLFLKTSEVGDVNYSIADNINDVLEFLRVFQQFMYFPHQALEKIKDLDGVTEKTVDVINQIESEIKEWEPRNGAKITLKVSKVLKIIFDAIYYPKGESRGEITIVVLPDMDLTGLSEHVRTFQETTTSYQLQPHAEYLNVNTIEDIFLIQKEDPSKSFVISMTESLFDEIMNPGFFPFNNRINGIHLFPLKYVYSPEQQYRVSSLFGAINKECRMKMKIKLPKIFVYFAHNRLENMLVTYIYKRKKFFFNGMRRFPEMWAQKNIIFDLPMIRISRLSLFEDFLSVRTLYDVNELTPLEVLKTLFCEYGESNGKYYGHVSFLNATMSSGDLMKPSEGWKNYLLLILNKRKKKSEYNHLRRFINEGYKLKVCDVMGLVELLKILIMFDLRKKKLDRDQLISVISVVTSVLIQYLNSYVSISQKLQRDLKDSMRQLYYLIKYIPKELVGNFKAAESILVKIYSRTGKDYSFLGKKPANTNNESLLSLAQLLVSIRMTNPMLLVFLALVTTKTIVGAKLFIPRLVDWYKLYSDDDKLRRERGVVREAVMYLKENLEENIVLPNLIDEGIMWF